MKIKFNLGWILAVAAAIVLAGMGFMSFYYLTGGKLILGIIVAAILLVAPLVVCACLAKAKGCSKPFYFHRAAVTEYALLIVMFVLMIGAVFAVNHFFKVNGSLKQIQEVVGNQREQLNAMTNDYNNYVKNRVSGYKTILETVKTNRSGNEKMYDRLFGNDTTNKVQFIVDQINMNLSIPPQNSTTPKAMSNEHVHWWQLPTIMNNVDTITSALQNRYDFLVERSKNDSSDMAFLREYSQDNPRLGIVVPEFWTYSYGSSAEVMSYFTESKGLVSSVWSVICGLCGILLTMLPYIVTERDSRRKGLLKELRQDADDDNEISGKIGKL